MSAPALPRRRTSSTHSHLDPIACAQRDELPSGAREQRRRASACAEACPGQRGRTCGWGRADGTGRATGWSSCACACSERMSLRMGKEEEEIVSVSFLSETRSTRRRRQRISMHILLLRIRVPVMLRSSQRTTTIFWPDSSCLATTEASRPMRCPRASITTTCMVHDTTRLDSSTWPARRREMGIR